MCPKSHIYLECSSAAKFKWCGGLLRDKLPLQLRASFAVPRWRRASTVLGPTHKILSIHVQSTKYKVQSTKYKVHYCLVSLMWMKIGSNDITAQVPGVS
jgi:hypothetical protein